MSRISVIAVLVYLTGVALNVRNDNAMYFMKGGYANNRHDFHDRQRLQYIGITLGSFLVPLVAMVRTVGTVAGVFGRNRG